MLDEEQNKLLAMRDAKATAIRITFFLSLSLSLSGSTGKRMQCAFECLRAMRRYHEVMHASWCRHEDLPFWHLLYIPRSL